MRQYWTSRLEIYAKVRGFLGERVFWLLIKSILPGALWFAVELGFVFVLQSFLGALGLVDRAALNCPKWWPSSVSGALGALLIYGFFRAAVQVLRQYTAASASENFIASQRKKIFRYSLESSGMVSMAESIAVFTEMVGKAAAVINNVVLAINISVSLALISATATKLAPIEFFIGVLCLTGVLVPLRKVSSYATSTGELLSEQWKATTQSLVTGLRNNFIFQIYHQIPERIRIGYSAIDATKELQLKYSKIASFRDVLAPFFGICVIALVTVISLKFKVTTPISLLSFFYLFMRFAQQASEFHGVLTQVKVNFPGFRQLYSWHVKLNELDARKSKSQIESAVIEKFDHSIRSGGLSIALNNVDFGYHGRDDLFRGLNLQILPGKPLVVKGPSGCGKSTLLKLVLGLEKPSNGEVTTNGFPVDLLRDEIGSRVGYVGPESYFIPATIRQNLLYLSNRANVSDAEIWQTLEVCKMKQAVDSLPEKLDTVLTELVPLSTGQKQRLSFAAALLREPKLLLLDEATANLDSATEMEFVRDLAGVLRGMTSIIVTHKNSFDHLMTQDKLMLGIH